MGINNENTWVNDFKGQVFFPCSASTSRGVLIAYLGNKSFVLKKQKKDQAGRTLTLDITIDAGQYILNANNETEPLKIPEGLQSLLKSLYINQDKRFILAGDLNIFFNSKLKAKGGKALPKRKSIVKLVEIKKNLDICNN